MHYSAKYLPRAFNENENTDAEGENVVVTSDLSSRQAIELLLQYGANVNCQDADGVTPLAIACQRGNYYGVVSLVKASQIDIEIGDNQGSTALHEACENGSIQIVKLLLAKGATISIANTDGVTPLHIACREGYDDIVNYLLLCGHHEKDVLVTAKDIHGSTSLHFAVESGNEKVVESILVNGANPIAKKKNEVTPLHIAARNGNKKIAALLLEYRDTIRTDFNIIEMPDNERNTPLHFAARHNQCEMIKYLVQK